MKIKKYIQKFRSHFIKYIFLGKLIYIGILGSVLFSLLIFLESIFYFSPDTKLIIIYSIIFCISIFTFYWLIMFQMIKNEKIKSYRVSKFAQVLGEKLFPQKKDTIINALQLEYGSKKDESKSLADAYIKSILKKLYTFDLSLIIFNKNRSKLKATLLISWIFVIIMFSFNYQSSSDSYFRWSNPGKKFLSPKPFKLFNTTGPLHILGGEKSIITIKASSIIPDTVLLQLTPTQVSTQKRDSLKLEFSCPPTETGEFLFELPEL